jgi:hypothetical protein
VNPPLLAAIAVIVWGVVFVLLLVSIAVQTDVERRWDEAWAIEWERVNERPIDELIDRLARQMSGLQTARRLLTLYLLIALGALAALLIAQYRVWLMPAGAFSGLMLFGLALLGLLFLPLRVAAEIGSGVVEVMYRQVRVACGERLVISSVREMDGPPRPAKPVKKKPAETPAAK